MAEHPLFENFRKGMAIRNPFVDRLAIGVGQGKPRAVMTWLRH
jgi:hypothetical protein